DAEGGACCRQEHTQQQAGGQRKLPRKAEHPPNRPQPAQARKQADHVGQSQNADNPSLAVRSYVFWSLIAHRSRTCPADCAAARCFYSGAVYPLSSRVSVSSTAKGAKDVERRKIVRLYFDFAAYISP